MSHHLELRMNGSRVKQIVSVVLELGSASEDARAAIISAECGDDESLRREVLELLAAFDSAERHGFLGEASAPTHFGMRALAETPPLPIGPYRILEPLGRGGMGVVYIAEQVSPIKRKVALKIIKAGMDTREVIARFVAERQALALMDHPNIARIFDAGVTDTGLPYFVMELVPGVPIAQFCDENKLTTRQRIELFIAVCNAVQHAHQKGIIHRDIKSSNVLAYLVEGQPMIKVIDFGIAKAVPGDRLTEETLATSHGDAIGTLATMSPEQAAGLGDIDTRSDVYSLGVLLYQLLSGSLPFEPHELLRGAREEARRVIREVDPPKPSTRLGELDPQSTTIAAARSTVPKLLVTQLRSELEWIPLKALRKDRTRRYQSPAELAEDIGNYLAGRALIAGPESRVYSAQKFARRNRVGIAVAMAFVALIVGGTGFYIRGIKHEQAKTLKQREEARRQAALATERFTDVRKIAGVLLFDINDKIKDLPGSVPARNLLVGTGREYLDKLRSSASEDVNLQRDLADAYERLGDVMGGVSWATLANPEGALTNYRSALSIRQRLSALNPNDSAALSSLAKCIERVGNAEGELGDKSGQLHQYREAFAILSRLDFPEISAESADRFRLSSEIHNITGDRKGALDRRLKAQAIREKLVATDPLNLGAQRDLSRCYHRCGSLYSYLGDFETALSFYRKAKGTTEKLVSASPTNMTFRHDLAGDYERIGVMQHLLDDKLGAIVSQQKSLQITEKLADADPTITAFSGEVAEIQDRIGLLFSNNGDLQHAIDCYTKALVIREVLAEREPQSPDPKRYLILSYAQVGDVLQEAGNLTRSMEVLRKGFSLVEGRFGDKLAARGEWPAAEECYRGEQKVCERILRLEPNDMKVRQALVVRLRARGLIREKLGFDGNRVAAARLDDLRTARGWRVKELDQLGELGRRNQATTEDAAHAQAARDALARYDAETRTLESELPSPPPSPESPTTAPNGSSTQPSPPR